MTTEWAIPEPESRLADRKGPVKILVVGGSQGAAVFNDNLPEILSSDRKLKFQIWHQCGKNNAPNLEQAYAGAGLDARIGEFIEDMAAAYSWSDVVICRSGAMTVSELCNAGAVAIFVPYPHAVNDHQAKNAAYLVNHKAALMVRQEEFLEGKWLGFLRELTGDRPRLTAMAKAARALAKPDASSVVADCCMEAANA